MEGRHLVEVAVQTHPAREHLAEPLAEKVGATCVYDPDPTAYRSPWRTYRTILERWVDSPASHLCVLQDDALPCDNFREALDLVVAARPDSMIALFVAGIPRGHRDAVWQACDRDETFAVLPQAYWVPAVAVVWPTWMIQPTLEFVDAQRWPVTFSADDEIIGRTVRNYGWPVVATVPNLVEHPDVVESLVGKWRAVGGLNPDRVSCCFIDGNPLDVEWR